MCELSYKDKSMDAVRVRNVVKSYGELNNRNMVLKKINITVTSGSMYE